MSQSSESAIAEWTSEDTVLDDQMDGPFLVRENHVVRRRKPHFAGLLFFTASLMWCVAGRVPLDARVNPHWTHVRGSASLTVGMPLVDAHGVKYYPIKSIYQGSEDQVVRVLEPTNPAAGKPRRLLYVLPVDTGVERLTSTWGDGLEELRLLDVANRFNLTLIAPSFNYEPWYGDNDQDHARRMESFIVNDLVPFGDTFAKDKDPRRFLIGFSKSGNGALDLILRHPEVFSEAAVWDCPAQLKELSAYSGLKLNFGSQANFDRYDIPALLSNSGEAFRHENRLWISGDQSVFTEDMMQLHNQLKAVSIPHTWVQGGARPHNWHSGWLIGAVSGLDTIDAATRSSGEQAIPAQNSGHSPQTLASLNR